MIHYLVLVNTVIFLVCFGTIQFIHTFGPLKISEFIISKSYEMEQDNSPILLVMGFWIILSTLIILGYVGYFIINLLL